MISFFICLLLAVDYLTYSKIVERIFVPDDRPTPAISMADGVDYVEMATWKVF